MACRAGDDGGRPRHAACSQKRRSVYRSIANGSPRLRVPHSDASAAWPHMKTLTGLDVVLFRVSRCLLRPVSRQYLPYNVLGDHKGEPRRPCSTGSLPQARVTNRKAAVSVGREGRIVSLTTDRTIPDDSFKNAFDCPSARRLLTTRVVREPFAGRGVTAI